MSISRLIDDDQMEDGEIKRSPPPFKAPSVESLSLTDDEANMDPLEIKPPQAHAHKRARKSKHSSSSKHGPSDHRKKHHHSRSHRDERHHHHRDRGGGGGSKSGGEERDRSRGGGGSTRSLGGGGGGSGGGSSSRRGGGQPPGEQPSTSASDHQPPPELQRQREEQARRNREIERDLRDKLEKRRLKQENKESVEERRERDLRRQRLMEAERVKETYRKDIEERMRRREARERSRSRERKLEAEAAEAAAQKAAAQRELEQAGLVVLSDESRSPVPSIEQEGLQEETEEGTAAAGGVESQTTPLQSTAAGQEPPRTSSDPRNGANSTDPSSPESESSTDTEEESTDSSDGDTEEEDKNGRSGKGGGDRTPPLPPVSEDMELEKDPLPPYLPAIQGCRSVEEFQCLNRIEEGTYGVVYRARDKRTEEIVALKRLKMEKEKEGFPITSLREINTLLKAQHPNIVTVREIVVGSNMDKIFIVMDYVEHDLKSLMETMKLKKQAFIPGEVKCLMQQLLRAVAHLHDNWILHRDLKASNLLLSHKGILKVGDFGLAREYGSPLKPYTPIVVTLWYRAPELLLGAKEYSTHIDMWSVGCIFAELLTMEPLFTGKSEQDQLNRIFKTLGTPNERVWPGYSRLPAVQRMTFAEFPVSTLRSRLSPAAPTEAGFSLLNGFLTYNPVTRLTAEGALEHEYFRELPLPIDPAMFPTWPAKSEGHKIKKVCSPKPPSGGRDYKQLEDTDEGFHLGDRHQAAPGPGFSLKF